MFFMVAIGNLLVFAAVGWASNVVGQVSEITGRFLHRSRADSNLACLPEISTRDI